MAKQKNINKQITKSNNKINSTFPAEIPLSFLFSTTS